MPRGLQVEPVTQWLREHVPGLELPLDFELVAAGGSNLTYQVKDASGRRYALRRPPEGKRLATAHDVGREVRVMGALSETTVPVPDIVASCEDESVTGAPFFVMSFLDGLILRDQAAAEALDADACRRATDSLIDVHVALHATDIDAIGLGSLAKREGYVERQLARWRKQAERSKTRDLPLLSEIHDRLAANVPPASGAISLVHGDYRFDNCVLGNDDQTVIGVLDWELCTLGDPVADFCWSLLYWADPGDEYAFLNSPPTLHPAFPRRADVAESYARKSGRDLSELSFFTTFGWWKMACIVEGVYARLQAGSGGGMATEGPELVAQRVDTMLEIAARQMREI
ncbi:MAG: phosphotransferase family protein [Candidatus Binatia bacterium]|nr:phosphotransferase family protein [Candidatus Binatia bacterium]